MVTHFSLRLFLLPNTYKQYPLGTSYSMLLALPSSIAEDDVPSHSTLQLGCASLHTDETCLLCVLQVIPMTFGNFTIDCPFDPCYRVNDIVPPLLHEFDSEGVLGIDGPNDQHSIFLQFVNRNPLDPLVRERVILDGDSSGWLGGGQFPGWIHHDDIEVALSDLQLLFDELIEVEGGHVCTDRHCVLAHV